MGTLAIRIEKEEINAKIIRKEFPGDPRPFVLLHTANATFRFETQREIIWAESRDFLEQATTAGFNAQKKQWAKEYAASECNQHFFIDKMEVPKREFMAAIDEQPYIHPYQLTMNGYVLYDKKHEIFLQEEVNKWTIKNFFNATRYWAYEDAIKAKQKAEATGKFHLVILEIEFKQETTKIIEA